MSDEATPAASEFPSISTSPAALAPRHPGFTGNINYSIFDEDPFFGTEISIRGGHPFATNYAPSGRTTVNQKIPRLLQHREQPLKVEPEWDDIEIDDEGGKLFVEVSCEQDGSVSWTWQKGAMSGTTTIGIDGGIDIHSNAPTKNSPLAPDGTPRADGQPR